MLGEYFDNIWIMPNPGDAGSSLGAAALSYGKRLDWQTAFLGTDIPGEYPVKDILNELVTNKIVGVASGRAEFGPRALGNRSLLADPRGPDIKDRVNEIKRRQKFRPFAPVILEELAEEYFAMPRGWKTSPYMQTVAGCLRPQEFPAIVHADETSRVQTVSKDGSGIRQLLEAWYTWTGCPMLLNTSLNIRGEPMVNDRADADRFEKLYGVRVLS
jgi:carbamoyltransferase